MQEFVNAVGVVLAVIATVRFGMYVWDDVQQRREVTEALYRELGYTIPGRVR